MNRAAGNRRRAGRPVLLALVSVLILPGLVGCNGFFVTEKSTGGPTNGSGNAVYVANATTKTVSGFAIGTGTLTALSGSPYGLNFSPTAIAVTPAGTVGAASQYVYVGGSGSIYMYTVGTNGALTAGNSGLPLASANVQSMDISPDGKWLFVLDQGGTLLYQFAINASNGSLAGQIGAAFSSAVVGAGPRMVKVSPNNAYVFVALGLGGDLVYGFNTTTGLLTSTQTPLTTGSPTLSDNALAVDANSAYLYVARSGPGGGLMVFTIGTGGALNAVTGSPFATGTQPISVVLDGTGKYVYVANRADSTVSEFVVGTGNVLTPVSGSPFAAGTDVTALAQDSTGKYVLAAANGGSSDLTMYGFDSTVGGKLNSLATSTTGADPTGPVAIAVTH